MVNANEHIDIIEKRLKVQICITGDVSRIPRIETKLKVNLFLQNSHFSIEPSSKKPAVKGVSWQDRKPITYHYNKDTYDYTLYDGEKEYTETEAKVWQMNRVSGASVLIKVAKKEKLQLEYNTFIDQADKLKVESKGLINMYKSGTIKATALQLFSDFTKAVEQPDSIKGIEGEWILDCYRGGLLDATPYEGKAYKYDVSSMYPYIMNNMRFAYKEGELKLLTQEEMSKWIDKKTGKQYFKYGMYRAVISGDIKKPVFRANVLNRFTHIDMDTAFKEGYTIALIEDGGCNFIYYPESSRISGKELFKKYFEVLYPIKAKHVKEIPALNYSYAKSLMNILWGALAEKRIYQKIYTGMYDDKEVRPLGVNEKITNTVFLGNGKKMHETEKLDDFFLSGFARIAPFLTAKGRQMMCNIIRDNCEPEDVKRIHTDGIITSVALKGLFPNKKEAKLGELGYEGYCDNCVVKNMASPIGDFII
jgi:hypothetical protein